MKLKWRVSPVPTSLHRLFQRRGWPTAYYDRDETFIAATILCDDEYIPADVKTGNHKPLIVRLAFWIPEDKRNGRSAFEWKQLRQRAATLAEAKKLAQKYLEANKSYWPEGIK